MIKGDCKLIVFFLLREIIPSLSPQNWNDTKKTYDDESIFCCAHRYKNKKAPI